MYQDTLNESFMPTHIPDDPEVREGDSISVSPITRQQWAALETVASGLGGTRSDLLRDAIGWLLDQRDAGVPVTYTAAPRLHGDERKGLAPRIVWLKSPLLERFRDRCIADRVSQSEFVLEALRRYFKDRKIDIDPAI
jgi:hypothetical protein